jgi:hypothetical protein
MVAYPSKFSGKSNYSNIYRDTIANKAKKTGKVDTKISPMASIRDSKIVDSGGYGNTTASVSGTEKIRNLSDLLSGEDVGELGGIGEYSQDTGVEGFYEPATARLRALRRGRQKLTPEMLELLMNL